MEIQTVNLADLIIFVFLVVGNICLGLYFAIFKKKRMVTTNELFLGSRSLKMFPLAVSTMATMVSGLGIIGFTAHYYAYGLHVLWASVAIVLVSPLLVNAIVPVLYELQVTSVFQYLRMRFGKGVSMPSCAVFYFVSQTVGALAISATSVAVSTVFHVPQFWTSLAIGLTGTVYTALGGLRGVVWTDCMQALLLVITPATVIIKVGYDIIHQGLVLRPFSATDFRNYMLNTSFDAAQDENLWSCLIGLLAMNTYRTLLDQTVAQRYLAARTLSDAKRTVYTGTILTRLMFVTNSLLALTLRYWYRDCDPELTGEISKPDQILPLYVIQNLSTFPGFCGIFLAGVVGATTSTISSLINSQATVCYVDIVSEFRFLNGTVMTVYAITVTYMGSVGRTWKLLNRQYLYFQRDSVSFAYGVSEVIYL
ncbi:putative sodium-dependent multivitamin transporter [Ixodes scapularis]|uniref:putative sodium-dependent multivitamin transporter n=1 Tax=Ixodes scapularis TaxID=6945 RepID=UPI001A9FD979|nr:putative sodium-dependent multivitamin transporter [Ixodes scapularis]